MMPLQ